MTTVIDKVAPIDDFIRLREISGLSPRSVEAAEKGLPNSLYGVHLIDNGQVVGMGRLIGDGGLNFDIVDIAVDPDYQGRGFGRLIMESIMAYIEQNVPKTAYITLMADVPELYLKFGFEFSRPETEGMWLPWS